MIRYKLLNHVGQTEDYFKSFIVKSGQKIDLETITEFTSSQTQSTTSIKVVVMSDGHVSLKGIIKIKPEINQIEAFLKHSVLLIGQNSTAISVPELEIESDDVRASHSSAISQIDSEQLFYLMSRGFSHSQALKLIIKSFLSSN